MRYVVFLVFALLLGCTSTIEQIRHSGVKRNLSGKKFYVNGFSHYKLVDVNSIKNGDTTAYKEIRFYDVYSALYLPKSLEQKLGPTSYEVADDHVFMRVWENIKIVSDKKFTIAADGYESSKEMYTSAAVFNEQGNDCLQEGHPMRDYFIAYFSEAIWNYKE